MKFRCFNFCSAFVLLVAVLIAWDKFSVTQREVLATDSIVITGSSSGIGKHAALAMNAIGFKVFACVRKMKDFDDLKKTAVYPDRMIALQLDVTNDGQLENAVKIVEAEVGNAGLTAIYGNAGTNVGNAMQSTAIEFSDIEDWKWLFDVNVYGNVRIVKAFLPLLRRHKNGKIIFNTSVAGLVATPFVAIYSATKFAMGAIADSLRQEVREFNIDVVVIAPGFIYSKLSEKILNPSFAKPQIPESQAILYPKEKHGRNMWEENLMSCQSPKVTSDALIDAVLSSRPSLTYVAGGLADVVNVLSILPKRFVFWLNTIAPVPTGLSEQQKADLLQRFSDEKFNAADYTRKP